MPGEVLVAPLTDPAWTPLFLPAAAVVVNVGALMSHAVIVSRELAIPCVVSVADATKQLADGMLVEVDGTAGTVTVLEPALVSLNEPGPLAEVVDERLGHLEGGEVAALVVLAPVHDVRVALVRPTSRTGGTISFG